MKLREKLKNKETQELISLFLSFIGTIIACLVIFKTIFILLFLPLFFHITLSYHILTFKCFVEKIIKVRVEYENLDEIDRLEIFSGIAFLLPILMILIGVVVELSLSIETAKAAVVLIFITLGSASFSQLYASYLKIKKQKRKR